MKLNVFRKLTALLATLIFVGCVGTIEDNQLPTTKAVSNKTIEEIQFDGIQEAIPISHNKINIYFAPSDIDPELITYLINYDGLANPIPFPAVAVEKDYKGRSRITLRGLTINTIYNIGVEVYHKKTKVTSSSGKTVAVSTFGNITADFEGISAARNLPGQDGLNSVKIEWPAAITQGTPFSPEEIDVIEYQVTVLNANALGPGDFDNTSFSAPDRRVVPVGADKREVTVTGLLSATKYLVQVRAIHFGYTSNSLDESYKVEKNDRYLEIETLSDDLSLIEFDTAGVVIGNLSGENGLYGFSVDWSPASGAFDHYRIYYAPVGNNVSSHSPAASCQSESVPLCKKLDFDAIQTTLSGLQPYTEYEVVVVVCQKSDCQKNESIFSNVQTKITTQAAAPFGGIVEILPARYADRLDEVYLTVQPPQTTLGIADGVRIVLELSGTEYIINDPANGSGVFVEPFDHEVATEYTVTGIDVFGGQSYCFTAYVITYDDEANIVEHKDTVVQQCTIPTIDAPTFAQFSGLNEIGGCSELPGALQVSWSTPSGGVYSKFEVIYRPVRTNDVGQATFFATGTAKLDDYDNPDNNMVCELPSGTINNGFTDETSCTGATGTWTQHFYRKWVEDPDAVSQTLTNLPPGQTYEVGVISYFRTISTVYRSEYNSNIETCTAQ